MITLTLFKLVVIVFFTAFIGRIFGGNVSEKFLTGEYSDHFKSH